MKKINQVIKERTLADSTLVREGVCDGCGEEIEVYKTKIVGGPNKGKPIEVTYGCKCEDIKLAKKAMEAKERNALLKAKEYFNHHSLINDRLKNVTIDDYQPLNASQKHAKDQVQLYIDEFNIANPKNLLLTGTYGVGKSHLAKAITDEIMKKENPRNRKKYSAIFISVPKLLRKIRSTYNRNSELSENDVFDALEKVDLLVLDDIGAERQNDWSDERLFDLIDSRDGKHTIFTSNYDEEGLYQLLGERNFSRMTNDETTILHIEGDNYRFKDLIKS